MALLAAAVYANTLGHGFARDDVRIVQQRELVQRGNVAGAFEAAWWPRTGVEGTGLYRPVTLASLAVQWRLFGGDPTGFHVVSVFLHAAVSVGVLLLLGAFLPLAAAGAGAALFAVHPVHVEAVAPVVGQAELHAALLGLGCTGAYLWCVRQSPGPRRAAGWVGVAGLYLLALLSKENAVALPGVLLLVGASEAAAGGGPKRKGVLHRLRVRFLDELPLFALLAAALGAYLVLRLQVLGTIRGEVVAPPLVGLTDLERIYTSLSLWPEYLRLLLVPVDLAAGYAPGVLFPARTLDGGVVLGGATLLLLVGAVAAGLPRRPMSALGIGWFVVTVLPVSNLVFPTGLLLAERVLYLPSVGLALVVGDAVRATRRRSARIRRRAIALGVIVLLALGTRTAMRNPVWKNSATVLASLKADHPRSHVAIHAGGVEAFNAGRIQEADSLFTEALRLVPWHYQTIVEAVQLHAVTGDWDRASALFDRAVTLHPRSRKAYRLFALRLLEAGRPAEARRIAHQGIGRIERSPWPLWAVVADAWEDEGREGEAARARRAAQARD